MKADNPKHARYPIPIREWSEDDRPREKLLKYGEHTPCNVYLPLAGLPRVSERSEDPAPRGRRYRSAVPRR